MPAKSCSYIIADGHVCGSPAIRGTLFCYYHSRDRQRTRILRRRGLKKRTPDADTRLLATLNLPTPDNPVATQVCIAGILQAMMAGAISAPLGGRLLYGLHMAKCNYREVDAFRKRYLDSDIPYRVVPIAATDPEPIVDLDAAPEEQQAEVSELQHYAKALKVESFERPSISGEITEAECASDSAFMAMLESLQIEDEERQQCITALHAADPGQRRLARAHIFELVQRRLEELKRSNQSEARVQ